MSKPYTKDAALTPYRVLDLTEGGFNWRGRILADLGTDVIKVEPPGGSPKSFPPSMDTPFDWWFPGGMAWLRSIGSSESE